MKTVVYDSVGLKWNIDVPTTADEYNTLAKRPDACLQDAIDHTVYHDTLGEIRYEFAKAVSAALLKLFPDRKAEWERKEIPTGAKDDEGNAITKDENDGAFLNRLLALSGKSAADFPEEKATVEAKVKFDPSVRERKLGQPKTAPKSALNAANDLLMLNGKEVNGKVVDVLKIVAHLEGLNPEAPKAVIEANGLPSADSFGKLIAANEARKRAAVKLSAVYADAASIG